MSAMKLFYGCVFVLLMLLGTGLEVSATNGYFSHGYGVRLQGLAGAGTAVYFSPIAATYNPASLAYLGNSYDVSLSLFSPSRQYTITGSPSGYPGTFPLTPGTVESDNKLFPMPTLSANWMLDDNSAVGVAIYGNGGMNTEYPTKTFNNPQAPVTEPTGVNMAQLFLSVTYSRNLGEIGALGLSVIGAYQYFEATGLQAFGGFSNDYTKLTDNDVDNAMGFGFRVGYLKEFDKFSIGASYQSKIAMGEFEDYAGLFAEEGDFDVPASWNVGVAVDLGEKLQIIADFQQILYSSVNSVGNKFDPASMSPVLPDGMTPNPGFKPLGTENASGFGWEDMNIFKLGIQYMANEDWTIRGGYSFGNNPIKETEVMFNILAPGVIEQHASLGFSKRMGDNELSFFATYALPNSVEGPNPFEAPNQQQIEIEMDQLIFGVGFTF
jgi:long-chain fatty acid transport protein